MKYSGSISLLQIFQNIKTLFDGLSAVAKSGSYNDLTDTPTLQVANVQVSSDEVTAVSIPETITSTDRLLVYHNGLLLSKDINYTIDTENRSVVLTDYTAESGDVFVFVSI